MKKHRKMLKDYHMVEKIRTERWDNLSISWDSDQFDPTPDNGYPVLLYTQDMADKSDHDHIKLTDKQALKLRNWLNKFLELKGIE